MLWAEVRASKKVWEEEEGEGKAGEGGRGVGEEYR